jgi:uncharacterized protein
MGWPVKALHRISGTARRDNILKKLSIALRSPGETSNAISAIKQIEPEMLIFSGDASLATAKKLARHKARKIFVGNPKSDLRLFDIAVASRHDVSADIQTTSHFYPSAGHTIWMDGVFCKPTPSTAGKGPTAVFIGGVNKAFALESDVIIAQINRLAMQQEALCIAFSRRTPIALEQAIRAAFELMPVSFVAREDRTGFLELLASAERFYLTPDSITMVCEACATSRPVQVFNLAAIDHDTPTSRFITSFLAAGYIRILGDSSTAPLSPWNDCRRVVRELDMALQHQST